MIYAGEGGEEGNYIVISYENELMTKYMHHDKIYVETEAVDPLLYLNIQ